MVTVTPFSYSSYNVYNIPLLQPLRTMYKTTKIDGYFFNNIIKSAITG